MNKKKRILYCDGNIDGTIGGSYFSLFYLAEGIDKNKYAPLVVFYTDNELIPMYRNAGIEVIILTAFSPTHINHFLGSRSKYLRKVISVLQSGINFFRFYYYFFSRAIEYKKLINKYNISLVHLNNSVLRNHIWILASKLASIKVITHERGLNNRFPFLARYFIKKLDAVLCISNAVHKNFYKHNVKSKMFYLVYNGLDPDKVVVNTPKETIYSQFGINQGDTVIGMVGNIKSWKGQDIVIEAVSFLKKKIPNIKCLLVGSVSDKDQRFKDEIDKKIEKLSVQENIIFTGYQKNIFDFMNCMEVVIHASTLGEPFGRVLLEAMALRKPLIGADKGAVPEIIVDGETGYLFKTGDGRDLAEKLQLFFNDMENANIMGNKGFERLNNNFHINENIKRTEELYEMLFS